MGIRLTTSSALAAATALLAAILSSVRLRLRHALSALKVAALERRQQAAPAVQPQRQSALRNTLAARLGTHRLTAALVAVAQPVLTALVQDHQTLVQTHHRAVVALTEGRLVRWERRTARAASAETIALDRVAALVALPLALAGQEQTAAAAVAAAEVAQAERTLAALDRKRQSGRKHQTAQRLALVVAVVAALLKVLEQKTATAALVVAMVRAVAVVVLSVRRRVSAALVSKASSLLSTRLHWGDRAGIFLGSVKQNTRRHKWKKLRPRPGHRRRRSTWRN